MNTTDDLARTNNSDKEKALAILKDITDFLNAGSYEATCLWNILTALRGPDIDTYLENPHGDIKMAFTRPLRSAIGIKTNYLFGQGILYGVQGQIIDTKFKKSIKNYNKIMLPHYLSHYQSALAAYKRLFDKEFYEEETKETDLVNKIM